MVLDGLLTPDELAHISTSLAVAPFRDGRATAGSSAREVKANEQAHGADPHVLELGRGVRRALERRAEFQTLVRPVRWSGFMFSRYSEGHRYGLHTDDAAAYDEAGFPLRTDVSFTVFLSDPATYEGGALRIVGPDGDSSFRPPAGTAVIYSTGLLHEVTPVTRGVRLACVGWAQSAIRRADRRELLFDLACARHEMGVGRTRLLLDKGISNLLRMWVEP